MGIVIKGDAPRTNSAWKEVKVQTSSQAAQKAGSSFLSVSNFKGTFIVVDHGKGNVNSAPTFRLQGNAGIDSIGFVYKEQAPTAFRNFRRQLQCIPRNPIKEHGKA